MSAAEGISAFWERWPDLRPRLSDAIAKRDFGSLPDEISALVAAIDPHLEWELGPGQDGAQHAFTLSAAGNAALRHLTERWLSDAPLPDESWEFHPARQPRRGMGLELGGHRFAHEDVQVSFEVDESVERAHLALHHPAFAELDENTCTTVTFLTLDGWLGEDGVERWVGHIEVAIEPPAGATTLDALGAAVTQLEMRATGERWALLQGEDDGAPRVATINRALKAIDHPLKTMRCEVRVRLKDPRPDGFPTSAEADVLDAMEDDLVGTLGSRVAFLGRITGSGVRNIVFFAPESSGVPSEVEAATRSWTYDADIEWTPDPRWEFARRFQ